MELPQVVLIGGSAGTGKTTLAAELAGASGADHLRIDDLRAGLDDPRAHALDRPWRESPARAVGALRDAADALAALVAGVVEEALGGGHRIVLEGEALHPRVAARYAAGPQAGAVFLVELDPARLAEALAARGRAVALLTREERATLAGAGVLFGSWLQRECAALGLPALPARPWATLGRRAREALAG